MSQLKDSLAERANSPLLKPMCSISICAHQTSADWMRLTHIMQASLAAQTVNRPPAMQEIGVHPLDQEYPMEKGIATHSSILAWRIPWTEELHGLQSMASHRVRHD